jgi:hypothetical protein
LPAIRHSSITGAFRIKKNDITGTSKSQHQISTPDRRSSSSRRAPFFRVFKSSGSRDILRAFTEVHDRSRGHPMITREMDRLLVHLAKVETGFSKVYERLSKKEHFRQQVQGFWFDLMNEELMHARVFDKIREKACSPPSTGSGQASIPWSPPAPPKAGKPLNFEPLNPEQGGTVRT